MIHLKDMLRDPHVQGVIARSWRRPDFSTVYFQWTCGGCGERVTCEDADSLYTSFNHEACGYETPTVDGDLGFKLTLREE